MMVYIKSSNTYLLTLLCLISFCLIRLCSAHAFFLIIYRRSDLPYNSQKWDRRALQEVGHYEFGHFQLQAFWFLRLSQRVLRRWCCVMGMVKSCCSDSEVRSTATVWEEYAIFRSRVAGINSDRAFALC